MIVYVELISFVQPANEAKHWRMKNQFDSEWQDTTKDRFGFESRGGSYQR